MTPRTQNAINVFLDAINNNTLAKGSCTACAVGNLIANSMGAEIRVVSSYDFVCNQRNNFWSKLFMTFQNYQVLDYKTNPNILEKLTIKQKEIIENTGFSLDELAQIEYAFERNTIISFVRYSEYSKEQIKQDQLKGLTAVVNLLLEMDKDVETNVDEVFVSKVKDLQLV